MRQASTCIQTGKRQAENRTNGAQSTIAINSDWYTAKLVTSQGIDFEVLRPSHIEFSMEIK